VVTYSPRRKSLIELNILFILFFLMDGSCSHCAKNVKGRAALAKMEIFYKGSAK